MAAPMRDSSLDSSGHRGKVVDAARTTTAKTVDAASTNFEYDDNEWDIGIGDLIIDLDADIEKTNENIIINNNNNNTTVTSLLAGSTPQIGGQNNMASTGANSGTSNSSVGGKTTSGKMAIEHSATVDKGLKMKIKRTKPGTKTSEAKHEIVKSNEMNGNAELGVNSNNSTSSSNSSSSSSNSGGGNSGGSTNSTQGSGNNSSNSGNDKGNSNSGKSNSTSSSSTNSTGPITNSGSNSSLVVNSANSNSANSNVAKRGSSSHRRDKANRDKHGSSSQNSSTNDAKQQPSPKPVNIGNSASSSSSNNSAGTNSAASTNCSVSSGNNNTVTSNSGSNSSGGSSTASGLDVVNGLVRTNSSVTSSSQQQQSATSRSVFPASTGPGPPGANANSSSSLSGVSVVGPQSATSASTTSSSSPSSITGSSGVTQIKTEQTKVAAVVVMPSSVGSQSTPGMLDDRSVSPPPSKKIKTSTDPKDMVDVCVGTSVGTITEPDCLGPCEPGTSVTLEGIVWHETEGGVLVVNVTWRGKTYVGTLLDCTRHDWAPPRFCDSPTSDLDARTPKGRGKRGRAAAAATTPGNDLSNFTETRSSVHSKLRNGGAKGRRGAASSGNSGNSSNSGSNNSTGTSSPTPFIPPRPEPSNKRKSRSGDDDPPTPAGKKSRVPSTVPASPVNASSGSPPASPVLLECPEPNCSKKYKHINGLKYHQSHAHGSSAEDDDTKDVTSMSENDESNIEAPSPAATPVKSPEKVSIDTTPASTPQKKDESVSVSSNTTNVNTDPVSQPSTPKSRPQSPQTPNILQQQPPPEIIPSVIPPVIDPKNNVVVKPGVLRFGPQEDGNSFSTFANKSTPPTPNSTPTSNNNPLSSIRTQIPPSTPEQPGIQAQQQPPTPQSLYQSQQPSPLQPTHPGQPPTHQNLPPFNIPPNQQQPNPMQSPNHQKLPQFKVKPTAALMPSDDKKGERERNSNNQNKPPGYKKKSRNKSPAGSPHPQPTEVPQQFTDSSGGREDVQSPAYSDISDDTAPPTVTVLDNDVTSDKNKTDKKTENNSNGGAPPQSMPPAHTMPPQYGMYPFYGQSPYLVPSVQQQQQPQPGGPVVTNSDKGPNKLDVNPEKNPTSEVTQQAKEKDPQAVAKKDIQPEFPPQKVLPPHYYPQYGYMQGYGYNIESPYGPVPMQVPPPPSAAAVEEQKIKEERHKESPSPADQHNKPPASLPQPIPNPIQVPTPTTKVKSEPKEKQHQNENHQILKESIEMKNQMSSPYMYSRQQPPPGHQPPQSNHNHHMQQHHPQAVAHAHAHAQQQQTAHMQQQQQREEELRRYYLYPDQQRRKEALEQQAQQQAAQQQAQQQQQQQQQPPPPPQKTSGTPKAQPSPGGLKPHSKDKQQMEEKKEKEIKQEGVKPTMETQGPPPPPTSQYAYIHPSYMQSPAGHYSAIPFDPNHPMYRSMLMHSPYAGNPYMHHPQIPRYHAPEDLSRGPPPGPTKALDILQHHANQYYTSHKIHELQERALKSPTPKTSVASSSPSANVGGGGALSQSQQIGPGGGGGPPPSGPGGVGMPGGPPGSGPQSCGPPGGPQQPPGSGNGGKQVPGDGKDSRSPPPQRHVHTHHHTHVGLGYPILAGQYPATYGAAAVLASQQAAAVTVINPYPPK